MMKLAVQDHMLPGDTIAAKAEAAARLGYDAIELVGFGLLDRLEETERAVKAAGLATSTVCAGYGGCPLDADPAQRRVAVEDSKRLLDAAARLGAVGLIFVPIFGPPRIPDLSPYATAVELERRLLLELVRELGEHAAAAGTLLLLEPLNRYETHFLNRLEQAVGIVEEAGVEGVAVMADFFHMNIEEADIPRALREAGPRVAHVHLADSGRNQPGTGHTDFLSGFAALKEISFGGYMALECGITGERSRSLAECAALVRRWWEEA